MSAPLPARWVDDLVGDLVGEWRGMVRGHAPPAMIKRLAGALAPQLRACFDRPPAGLTTANAERKLAPRIRAAEKVAKAMTEELLAETALAGDARKLHRIARGYHDDFVDGFEDVIEHEACAIGTALMIYWRLTPHWYRQWRRLADVPSWGYNRQRFRVLRRIEQRMKAKDEDRLRHLGVVFDPRAWKYDLTRDAYRKEPRLTEIPAALWIRTTAEGIEPLPPLSTRTARARSGSDR